MKTDHKLFFAIPFDAATKNLYKSISAKIKKKYPTITTVIGNEEIGPSPKYSDFASFKAQNKELTRQFVAQIVAADIVIADLTHNNPNVHIELGIALTENKNILRVTGRSLSELGFDIRSLDTFSYRNEGDLLNKILSYLKTFLEIKKIPISKEYRTLYCEEPVTPLQLRALNPSLDSLDFQSRCSPDFLLRDGAVQVDFEILKAKTPSDWFGIYFRAADHPLMGSYLLYVRKSGKIEIALYPGQRIIKVLPTGQDIEGRKSMLIEFENNYLKLKMGDIEFQTDELSHQTPGRIFQAAWNADVDVHSVQMICRDTIEWNEATIK